MHMDTTMTWNVLMFYVEQEKGIIEHFFVDRHDVQDGSPEPPLVASSSEFTRCRVVLAYLDGNGHLTVDEPFVSSFLDPVHYVENLLRYRITGILIKDEYDYLGPFMDACRDLILTHGEALLPS